MKVPNADRAVVEICKLRDYCLNVLHDEGKHKARLFKSALDMNADNAEQLRNILLQIIKTNDAELSRRDKYGQRYTVDFMLKWQGKQAKIRSGWIIEHGSDIPRMTSCYPL